MLLVRRPFQSLIIRRQLIAIGFQQSGTVIDALQCASTSVEEQLSSNVSEKTPEKPLMVRTDE